MASNKKTATTNIPEPSTQPLIKAKSISLHVPVIRGDKQRLLSNPLRLISDLYLSRNERSVATLIDRASFTLEPGERLGLIGRNGAGESTLLRLLAGIYKPSSGALEVNGSAKGLFDISLGMLPEATGLENTYLRGLQMGLPMADIRKLIPEVIAFAELEEDINKPLATYSAGMRLRLAVAVSTMIEPDILLLDEWIGTGDARFSAKIKDRMMNLVESSSGVVLATHNTGLMTSLCTHGLVLDSGKIVYSGKIENGLAYYKEQCCK